MHTGGYIQATSAPSTPMAGWSSPGRIKDLIITAGGKNIAPQLIESRIKPSSPLVEELVVHGDRRPYCVAWVHLDLEATGDWADRQRLSGGRDRAALAAHPEVRWAVWADVEAVNAGLPSYATIKRVSILDEPLSVDGGELTPSLKVRRSALECLRRARLDALYEPGSQ